MLFLTTHTIWYAAILLLVPTTIVAAAGPLVIRRFVTLERLRSNNEVAGFKFATVGVIFAVLLAFAVIVVGAPSPRKQPRGRQSSACRRASTPSTALLRKATLGYLTTAIARDWPALEHGRVSAGATEALGKVYIALLKFHSIDSSEGLVIS